MRHKREVVPKKSAVVRFPSLYDPMHGISCNKETFSVDLLENNHAGKKRWGLVFCGVKSKLLDYYRLGSKEPLSASTLDAIGNFITEHRIPITIITDSDGVLGARKKWKHHIGKFFTPLRLSEQDKHNQNLAERAINNLKAGKSKIRNACGTGVLAYHCKAMEYLCNIDNYIAQASLGNQLPFGAFSGETPHISMIWFKFWEPVYYWNWTDKTGKVLMHPGRFLGFAWNIGDPMTLKVIQCNKDPHNRNIVVHRGVIVPHSTTTIGYDYALAPNSAAFTPPTLWQYWGYPRSPGALMVLFC